MKRGLLTTALLCLLAAPAMGWGQDGHRLVGDAAQKLLTHKARAHVIALLGNADLGAVANWADDLRGAAKGQGPLANDQEAERLNLDFPKNARWHFVDMPLGATSYAQAEHLGFASDDDVVHAIDRCIGVLDGSSDTTGMTKAEALRFLVHFVGDLHQPLHVCSGYYHVAPDKSVQLITDPNAAKGWLSDRGGNELFFSKGKNDELHALWDVDLVTGFEKARKRPQPVTRILRKIDAAAWADRGDYHHWAAHWAMDTLVESRHAYDGLTFGKAQFDPLGKLTRIPVKMNVNAYKRANDDVAADQIAKAAFRLAELLNRIWE